MGFLTNFDKKADSSDGYYFNFMTQILMLMLCIKIVMQIQCATKVSLHSDSSSRNIFFSEVIM